ncbi:MAG: hypothetical protein KFF72_18030 [Arthrospira sp. SH-MAG29]|nr:hypothetical protein [Arthrospira sp. SH-MAG29]MBS0018222.1 hypothetical protein [Arthrospira sp. SH-MAG29]
MLKYYLCRSGKIPTSVHPFVKQEELRKVKPQPQPGEIQVIYRLRNAFLGVWRSLSKRASKP